MIINQDQCEEEDAVNIGNGILREKVVAAIITLNKGKSAGFDDIPSRIIINGGETMINLMHGICSNIWETSNWPEIWTKSIIITIPKKGNIQQCNNYRTISLINHASKLMVKIVKNRLDP